jgi:hypothetical protein
MDYDKDKVDDMALALLWLTTIGEKQGGQVVLRAWKGHDWDALNRLHEKRLYWRSCRESKSVFVTEEGAERSEELFRQFFAK